MIATERHFGREKEHAAHVSVLPCLGKELLFAVWWDWDYHLFVGVLRVPWEHGVLRSPLAVCPGDEDLPPSFLGECSGPAHSWKRRPGYVPQGYMCCGAGVM